MGFKFYHSPALQGEKQHSTNYNRRHFSSNDKSSKIQYTTALVSQPPLAAAAATTTTTTTIAPKIRSEHSFKSQSPSDVDHNQYPTFSRIFDSTIVGQIQYKKPSSAAETPTEVEPEKRNNSREFSSSLDPLKSIEQQVIEIYSNEISKLSVRDAFKQYLRRTLELIVDSNGSLKLHLLDIRKQLRKTVSSVVSPSTEFLAFVDKLYQLAVDKQFSLIFESHEPASSNASSRGSYNLEEFLVNSRASGFISGASSPNINRLMHMNALQRLAQTYRNRLANLMSRNNNNNHDEQITESSIDREEEYEDHDNQQNLIIHSIFPHPPSTRFNQFQQQQQQQQQQQSDDEQQQQQQYQSSSLSQFSTARQRQQQYTEDDFLMRRRNDRMEDEYFLELLRIRMASLIEQRGEAALSLTRLGEQSYEIHRFFNQVIPSQGDTSISNLSSEPGSSESR